MRGRHVPSSRSTEQRTTTSLPTLPAEHTNAGRDDRGTTAGSRSAINHTLRRWSRVADPPTEGALRQFDHGGHEALVDRARRQRPDELSVDLDSPATRIRTTFTRSKNSIGDTIPA
jgi:hypothetical protein